MVEHYKSSLSIDKQVQYWDEEVQRKMVIKSEDYDATDQENFDMIISSLEHFDFAIIDSWQKLEEMNRKISVDGTLRKQFDGKLFFIIFQVTADGKQRGGNKPGHDADIIFEGIKGDGKPENNYFIARKNRYNKNMDLRYSPYYQSLLRETNEVVF